VLKRYGKAEREFAQAAAALWPFRALPEVPAEQTALAAARRFEEGQYRAGKATREEAVARYVGVADQFPCTTEHDLALVAAHRVCLERRAGGAQPDRRTAAQILARMEKRPAPPDVERGPQGAPARPPLKPAAQALREAEAVEEGYLAGRATRAEAVARYVLVADSFPGTIEHDEALNRAAQLYLQRFVGEAKRDLEKAKKLLTRLATRVGPISALVVLAEENLASFSPDPGSRMRDRSEHYLLLGKRLDPQWIADHLLTPNPLASPEAFARSVSEVTITMRGAQVTTAVNMVADAMNSSEALENLVWLRNRHRGDQWIERQVDRALDFARKHAAVRARPK
jgi:hypothetical protein